MTLGRARAGSIGSVGRASPSHGEGRWFESSIEHQILDGSVAQLAEHLTLNQGVVGSKPAASTSFSADAESMWFIEN